MFLLISAEADPLRSERNRHPIRVGRASERGEKVGGGQEEGEERTASLHDSQDSYRRFIPGTPGQRSIRSRQGKTILISL